MKNSFLLALATCPLLVLTSCKSANDGYSDISELVSANDSSASDLAELGVSNGEFALPEVRMPGMVSSPDPAEPFQAPDPSIPGLEGLDGLDFETAGAVAPLPVEVGDNLEGIVPGLAGLESAGARELDPSDVPAPNFSSAPPNTVREAPASGIYRATKPISAGPLGNVGRVLR